MLFVLISEVPQAHACLMSPIYNQEIAHMEKLQIALLRVHIASILALYIHLVLCMRVAFGRAIKHVFFPVCCNQFHLDAAFVLFESCFSGDRTL